VFSLLYWDWPVKHSDVFFLLLNGLVTSNRHIFDELYDLFSITLIDIRPEDIADL